METAALVQQKLQYEEQLHSLRQELGSLQQRLKESVERASRVRQHAERYKMLGSGFDQVECCRKHMTTMRCLSRRGEF